MVEKLSGFSQVVDEIILPDSVPIHYVLPIS